ncbi:MAG TPA: helix-turn-helix transcriptional regulator [Solirubrobacterales bacterium]|nr:helix-turn-helix transcriptional regulator [Solirubrobacterales bacterium]
MSLNERFSANLRRARSKAGITQEELGALTELHRTEISLLENGKRMPRLDTLVKLVCALECRSDDLIEGLAWLPNTEAHGRWVVEV